MVKIVQIKEKEGEKVLRQTASMVKKSEFNSPALLKILKDMKNALLKEEDGVAIAAPQIGISKRIFLINPVAYDLMKQSGPKPTIFINPQIVKISKDKKLMDEGCLSVRPLYGKVRRSSKATIKAQDQKGKEFEISGSGLVAQIFQHETDHLDGVLFIDKAKEVFELIDKKDEK
jgi:peptide deformylase